MKESKIRIKHLLSIGEPLTEIISLVTKELKSEEEAKANVLKVLDEITMSYECIGRERLYYLRLYQLERLLEDAYSEGNLATRRDTIKQIIALEGHETEKLKEKIEEYKVKFGVK